MYKVTVNTSGRGNIVVLGARYCFTRKTAIKLANLFLGYNCDITIAKFIRCDNVFVWSNSWIETKIVFDEDVAGNLTARKANKNDF